MRKLMRKLMTMLAVAGAVVWLGARSEAQCRGGRCRTPMMASRATVRTRVVVRQRATVRYYAAPAPRYYAAPATYGAQRTATPVQPQGDGPGAFLAALNAWRAMHGRHAVGWDSSLAAYAATNAGVHQPGSSGGAAQCWAGTSGYLAALRQWQASPAHAAILLNCTAAVGASPCPSGTTCNAR